MKADYGFTLIEILIALLIMALGVTSGISLFNYKNHQPLINESERLAALITLAMEENLLFGRKIAMIPGQNSYKFNELELSTTGNNWTEIRAEPLFRERILPVNFRWEGIRFDGTQIILGTPIILEESDIQSLEINLAYSDQISKIYFRNDKYNIEYIYK